MQMYYMGCHRESGHYLHNSNMAHVDYQVERQIYKKIGIVHADLDDKIKPFYDSKQGEARLTRLNGFTILSFWDNSIDTRPGSHSTFIISENISYWKMIELIKKTFPLVWSRYKFEIKLSYSICFRENNL